MKPILAVLLCLLLAPVAHATDWYIFDVGHVTCVNARLVAQEHGQPAIASPYAFRQAARGMSSYGGTKGVSLP
jgi:hypothetical protein